MLARLMGLKTISPVDLLPLIEAKAVSVFDVNSSQSWREAHVYKHRFARWIPEAARERGLSDRSSQSSPCSNFYSAERRLTLAPSQTNGL